MRLKNKVAIITGGGRGIGEAVARRFSEEGARVVICDVSAGDVARVEKDLAEAGAMGFVVDVTRRDQVDEMVRKTCQRFGTVDILINNAGITRDAMFHKMSEEDWDSVINVNLKGCFNCAQSVVGIMREKGYGKIVNISSTSRLGNVGQANYAASKAGLLGFTRTLAKELGPRGINVNAIAPGTILTEMFDTVPDHLKQMALMIIPLKRFGTVQELANACLFLSSDESAYITGQVINCDGGMYMT